MRAERDELVAHHGVAPANDADDVLRFEVLDSIPERKIQHDSRGDRTKVARLRLRAKLREIEARLTEQGPARTVGDPSTNAERCGKLRVARQHALLLRPRSNDGMPRVSS